MTNDEMVEQKKDEIIAIRKAAAEDLRLFALLHGGELDRKMLDELRKTSFAQRLGLVFDDQMASEAIMVIDEGLAVLDLSSKKKAEKELDELAADFAAIYLNHSYQASPMESPWLDEDGLTHSQPMFAVRKYYEKYGMKAENWRLRSDDHISLQLSFIAHLLDDQNIELAEAGRFMDEHLLRWLEKFARTISSRCNTPFYAGLAMLTWRHAEILRDFIEHVTGEPRHVPDEEESREKKEGGEEDCPPFIPGSGPGW